MKVETKKKLVKKATKLINTENAIGGTTRFENIASERVHFSFSWGTQLSDEQFEWVFQLFVTNMRTMYQISQWGYDELNKKQELRATTSRYIIARNQNDKPVAYLHYRFDVDFDSAVLYCYEIQVESAYQVKGIGSALLSIAECLAKKMSMDKLMATVFAFNGNSLAFFHKNGFGIDPSCPDDGDYVILSKLLSD
uniref:N-alpha-acetyltransferase 40 n=1 Tax=Elaeophora elaphi TaxID=1147741 RepID=A0A0R3RVW3_9BILA